MGKHPASSRRKKMLLTSQKCGCSSGNRGGGEREKARETGMPNRLGRIFLLFLQLVLWYMSLYKCVPSVRSFICAFSSSLSADCDNKNRPSLLSPLLYVWLPFLRVSHHYPADSGENKTLFCAFVELAHCSFSLPLSLSLISDWKYSWSFFRWSRSNHAVVFLLLLRLRQLRERDARWKWNRQIPVRMSTFDLHFLNRCRCLVFRSE